MLRPSPKSTLFPYTTLFRSCQEGFEVVRDEERSASASIYRGSEFRGRRRSEGELSAQRVVTDYRRNAVRRFEANPRSTGFRGSSQLTTVRDQVGLLKRVRHTVLVEARLPRRFPEAVHRLAGVTSLRKPEADRTARRPSNQRGIEIDHHVEEGLSLLTVEMREDRMERWGHDEARGTRVVRRDDLAVGGRIPLQEPRQGLGLDVDGC